MKIPQLLRLHENLSCEINAFRYWQAGLQSQPLELEIL